MRIRYLLGILSIFLAAIFLFWDPLLSTTSEWAIRWYARHKLGGELVYTSFEATEGKFIFHHPRIQKKNHTSLAADNLTISYQWHWLERLFKLNVVVETLDVNWREGQVDLHRLL